MRVALYARTSAADLGRPLDDDLAAAWAAQQHLRGREPSLAAIARYLHTSRRRVRARLQELGLLPQSPVSTG